MARVPERGSLRPSVDAQPVQLEDGRPGCGLVRNGTRLAIVHGQVHDRIEGTEGRVAARVTGLILGRPGSR